MVQTKKLILNVFFATIAISLFVTPSQSKADAVCQDGWYSQSEGSGTCSHHGGVSYWITDDFDNYPVLTFPPYDPQSYNPRFDPQIGTMPVYTYPSALETQPLYTSPPTAPLTPRVQIPSSQKSNSKTEDGNLTVSGILLLIVLFAGGRYWFNKEN